MSQAGSISGGGSGPFSLSLTGNSGGAVHPTLDNINIIGSGPLTIVGNPGTSTLTVSYSGGMGTNMFHTDSGTATESGNAITIAGGSNINTMGSGATVTVNLDNNVTISGTYTSTGGNLTLPGTSNDGATSGIITVGLSKISFADSQNVYIGYQVGTYPNVVGLNNNVAIGETCMTQAVGPTVVDNVAIGVSACNGVQTACSENIAIGSGAHRQLQVGDDNIALGGATLGDLTTADNNTAIGSGSLSSIVTGTANIGIGGNAGSSLTTSDSHNICIANVGVVGDNGVIRIGNSTNHVSTFLSGVYGVTPSMSPEMMTIGSDGELGSQALPLSSISITGDTGGALTGNSFTFTGGTTGLTFAGASTTETLGGTLVVSNGGTGATSFTNHGVMLGQGTSALGVTAVGTTGQVLTGVTGSNPVWASPAASSISITGDTGGALTGNSFTFTGGTTGLTFAGSGSTETLGGALVVAHGGTGNTTFTAYSVVCAGTTATGVFQNVSGVGSAGQVLTSNGAGALPTWQAAAVAFTWSEQTGTTVAMAVNNGYIANNGSLVTLTLPATAALGSIIEVCGKGAGGWSIAQNSGQTIHFGAANTTTGATGSLSSTLQYDAVRLVCSTANTDFVVLSSVGNLTVV